MTTYIGQYDEKVYDRPPGEDGEEDKIGHGTTLLWSPSPLPTRWGFFSIVLLPSLERSSSLLINSHCSLFLHSICLSDLNREATLDFRHTHFSRAQGERF